MRQARLPLTKRERKPRNYAEDRLQAALVSHLKLTLADGWFYFAVFNGGKMSDKARRWRAARGEVPGIPDLCFVGPGGRLYGLELKVPGGVVSENQDAVAFALRRVGAVYAVAYGIDEALEVLREWKAITSRPGTLRAAAPREFHEWAA